MRQEVITYVSYPEEISNTLHNEINLRAKLEGIFFGCLRLKLELHLTRYIYIYAYIKLTLLHQPLLSFQHVIVKTTDIGSVS